MFICDSCLCTYDNEVIVGGSCPQRKCEGRLVEIDEHIMPICVNLWKKGYDTKFSCEGHIDMNNFPYVIISIDSDRCDQLGIKYPDFECMGSHDKVISLSLYEHYHDHISFNDIDDGILESQRYRFQSIFSETISQIRKYIENMRKYESIRDVRIYIMSDRSIDIHIGLRSAIQMNGYFYPMEEVTLDFYKKFLEYKFFYLNELIDVVDELPDLNKEET